MKIPGTKIVLCDSDMIIEIIELYQIVNKQKWRRVRERVLPKHEAFILRQKKEKAMSLPQKKERQTLLIFQMSF